MPPRSSLTRSLDDYAEHRCQCGHIVYACQRPGDPCLVNALGYKPGCPCTDHRPRKRAAS